MKQVFIIATFILFQQGISWGQKSQLSISLGEITYTPLINEDQKKLCLSISNTVREILQTYYRWIKEVSDEISKVSGDKEVSAEDLEKIKSIENGRFLIEILNKNEEIKATTGVKTALNLVPIIEHIWSSIYEGYHEMRDFQQSYKQALQNYKEITEYNSIRKFLNKISNKADVSYTKISRENFKEDLDSAFINEIMGFDASSRDSIIALYQSIIKKFEGIFFEESEGNLLFKFRIKAAILSKLIEVIHNQEITADKTSGLLQCQIKTTGCTWDNGWAQNKDQCVKIKSLQFKFEGTLKQFFTTNYVETMDVLPTLTLKELGIPIVYKIYTNDDDKQCFVLYGNTKTGGFDVDNISCIANTAHFISILDHDIKSYGKITSKPVFESILKMVTSKSRKLLDHDYCPHGCSLNIK